MHNYLKGFAAVACVAGMWQSPVFAADFAPPNNDDSGWEFTVAPYLWAAGISGKSGVFGLPPQNIDLSIGDVLDKFEMGFMGLAEARKGPFSITTDIVYAKLGTSVNTPVGILANKVDITAKTFMGTMLGGYALIDGDGGRLDLVAGARLWSVTTDFEMKGGKLNGKSASDGGTWVDPIVGAKVRVNIGSNLYLSGWGMVGGFGVSSKSMWDVLGGLGYDFNRSFSVFGGYRAVSVDYSKNGFVYDMVQQGPIIGGAFHF